ncbi:two-component system regulatory protein [Xanthomonas fragariae]|uniref:Transcriptional regulatory protein BaeR n=1 Tax=Xanthomonas fragariae TaxID=48664 RepID=A0A1Y6H6L7_9XANT|nr:Transcriptional regulatory protein BaeR [Xanthomonas fragariae]SMR04664.1 two-component system regulatory protein [Xanthomonas fragariae]
MDRVYVDHRIVTNRTVDSHIKNLRCKLPDVGGEEWVRSVYGVGYRFEYLSEALPKTQQLHVNNAQRSHLQPPRRAGQRCLPWAYQREHEKPALASNAPSTIERMRPRRFTAATPQRPVSG